jgi:hypothetical protein
MMVMKSWWRHERFILSNADQYKSPCTGRQIAIYCNDSRQTYKSGNRRFTQDAVKFIFSFHGIHYGSSDVEIFSHCLSLRRNLSLFCGERFFLDPHSLRGHDHSLLLPLFLFLKIENQAEKPFLLASSYRKAKALWAVECRKIFMVSEGAGYVWSILSTHMLSSTGLCIT